jgi:hypothetical protein
MRRRHLTTAITMLFLCGLLVLGAVWGFKSLFAQIPSASPSAGQPSPTCKPQQIDAGQRMPSTQITVSVFNSGSRVGLASETLNSLANRGFKLGDIGNAPSNANVRSVQVWTTKTHDVEARLVALQFGKRVKVRVSKVNLGAGVDVVLGNGFRGLVRAPSSIRATTPQKVCAPISSPSPANG